MHLHRIDSQKPGSLHGHDEVSGANRNPCLAALLAVLPKLPEALCRTLASDAQQDAKHKAPAQARKFLSPFPKAKN